MSTSILKSIGTLAMGNGLSHVITFLGTIFLSRIYSPEEFGVYAVVFGLVAILSAVSSFRYEMTILLPKYKNTTLLALQVSMLATLTTAIIAFLIVLLMIFFGLMERYWLVLPISSFFSSVINIGSFLQNRNQQYKRIVSIQVGRAVLFFFTALAAFQFEVAGNGLVVGMAVSYMLPALWLLLVDFRGSKAFDTKLTQRRCVFWLKKHNKFLYYTSPAVFVSNLASQAPVFLLSYFVGSAQAGYYTMVHRVVMSPVMLLSGAVNKVYMQSITSRMAVGKKIYPFTVSLIKKSILPSCVISLIMLILFYYKTLELMFGTQWAQIDALASIMVPAFLISFIAKSIAGFSVLGRNELGLLYQLALLFLVSLAVSLSAVISGETIVIFSYISAALSLCFIGQGLSILRISRIIDESDKGKIS